MKVLIAVDGSPSSLDAIALVGQLINPAADEVAIYFSPLEVEKKLAGRPKTLVEGATASIIDEARKHLPQNLATKPEHANKLAEMRLLAPKNIAPVHKSKP